MAAYTAPIRDTRYLLNVIADLPQLTQISEFSHVTPESIDDILSEAGRFAAEVLAPLNSVGDREGCQWHEGGIVTTPTGFRDAYRQHSEAGWPTLNAPLEFGGQGLPHVIWLAVEEFWIGANLGFACYNALTGGAAAALLANGSTEVKNRYVPPLVSGQWSGTMNLTEPHCGTDLNLIRTLATPRTDGSYGITGTKIFISSGEHDLAENIVHLVLAKTAGAPDNLKGLSLFVVPKLLLDQDGRPAVRNGVSCTSIEHKMGIHGDSTCVMQYDNATGFLVGEATKGLAAMFVMMNRARLHVGMQGVGVAEAAYQHAVRYARERRQGRSLRGAIEPDKKADTLLVHPDVRRMLMECRALTEGCRALCLWTASQLDLARHAPAPELRAGADDVVALLTPVIKGFVTDLGFRCATTAQQVFGGHGYIRETGAEQFVRDARIAMIYEGANGIQALDLASRKIFLRDGLVVQRFAEHIARDIKTAAAHFPDLAERLNAALHDFNATTAWMQARAPSSPEDVGAAAYSYMELMGYLALGWMWLTMVMASSRLIADAPNEREFHAAKIATGTFYIQRILPEAMGLRATIESGATSTMALAESAF